VESEAADMLDGEMNIVWCSAVLHQVTWDQCVTACRPLVRFARGPGSLTVGCQVDSRAAEGELDMCTIAKEMGGERESAYTQSFIMWRA
jgi:hypothetical protein